MSFGRAPEGCRAPNPACRCIATPCAPAVWAHGKATFSIAPLSGARSVRWPVTSGLRFVTVNDARPLWGTPDDRPETVDSRFAARQSAQVAALIDAISRAPQLHDGSLPRDGFSTITGRAKFLRHGELFPDQPAPGTVIMAFQGEGRYYSMVDAMGMFYLKGVSTRNWYRTKWSSKPTASIRSKRAGRLGHR